MLACADFLGPVKPSGRKGLLWKTKADLERLLKQPAAMSTLSRLIRTLGGRLCLFLQEAENIKLIAAASVCYFSTERTEIHTHTRTRNQTRQHRMHSCSARGPDWQTQTVQSVNYTIIQMCLFEVFIWDDELWSVALMSYNISKVFQRRRKNVASSLVPQPLPN